MPETEGADEPDPLVRARLLSVLKDRPRLVDMGIRAELLDNMQERVEERRDPENVADSLSKKAGDVARQAGEPVVRDRAKNALGSANESFLSRL